MIVSDPVAGNTGDVSPTPGSEVVPVVSTSTTDAEIGSLASSDGSDREVSNDSRVIAIVSDNTLPNSDAGGEVLNISNQALLESEFPVLIRDRQADLSVPAQIKRFDLLSEQFRQYRNTHCVWESGVYSGAGVDVYITACNTWLNQQRAKAMRRQLSEKRANDANGAFFRGFYIEDGEGGIFQSCDRRQEWRLSGDTDILARVATRYDEIARDNLEMVYLEARGDLYNTPRTTGLSGNLRIRSLSLLRAIDENDCNTQRTHLDSNTTDANASDETGNVVPQSLAAVSPPVEKESDDVTVDTLGSAGFLYGYFSNWVSACAVENNTVCMAQGDSGYSGLGEWRLVVDRSLERRWRVQLIPTISDTNVDRDISVEIDDAVVLSLPVSRGTTIKAEIGITLAQGEAARQLVSRMRSGQSLSLGWAPPTEIGNELGFSLVGITRALAFFDQNG